jgi:peptidoglycan/LPS O-acetylase OafA/YrhL
MRGVSGRVETTSAKNPEHGSHGGGRAEPHPGNMLAYRSLQGSASSDHLDLVRGAAALLVMLGHLRNLFFVDFSEVASNANPLVKLVYLATGFSHYAVMIFFVLSGFLVGGGVLRGRIDGKWNWTLYSTNRLTRLWLVLIPALLIGAIWDHCGIHIFGTSGIYGGVARANVGIFAVQPRLSAGVMIGNALFLQDILTPTFGSNGPLWSLSYEFWYYVLFPLMLLAIPLEKVSWSTALFAIATFMVAVFIGETICLYFLIWLLGASINLAPEHPGARGSLWIVVGAAAVVLVVAVVKFKPGSTEYSDFMVGVASAVLIYALLRSPARSRSGLYSRAARGLAGFSYTLYVVHLPALVFISAWLVPQRRWQPDAVHVAMVAGLGICALGYAFVIARLTEYRTDVVRSRVTAAMGPHG